MDADLSNSSSSSFRQHLPFLRLTTTLQIWLWSSMGYYCSNTELCYVNTNPNSTGTWYIELCLQVWIFSSLSFKPFLCLEIITQTMCSYCNLSVRIIPCHFKLTFLVARAYTREYSAFSAIWIVMQSTEKMWDYIHENNYSNKVTLICLFSWCISLTGMTNLLLLLNASQLKPDTT